MGGVGIGQLDPTGSSVRRWVSGSILQCLEPGSWPTPPLHPSARWSWLAQAVEAVDAAHIAHIAPVATLAFVAVAF